MLEERMTKQVREVKPFGREMLVREHEGIIRGVLSDKYQIRNHSDSLQSLYNEVGEMEVQHVLTNSDSSFLSIRATDLNNANGELTPSISLSNGEVGNASTSLMAMVYRLVCTNGMISPRAESLHRFSHRGMLSEDRFYQGVRLVLRYAETSKALFLQTKKKEIIDVEAEIIEINDRLNFPKKFAEEIQKAYNIEPMPTGFGVINAVTRAAQFYDDPQRRLEVEKSASNLLKVYAKN